MSTTFLDRPNTSTRQLVTDGDPEERFPVPEDLRPAVKAKRTRGTASLFDKPQPPFELSTQLQHIVESLIDNRQGLKWLREHRIKAMFKRVGGRGRSGPNFGGTVKLGGLFTAYTEDKAVVWLAADHCHTYQLTRWQVEAALYSVLCNLHQNDKGELTLTGPDVVAHVSELYHYGAWRHALEQAKQQLALFDE